MLYLQFNIYYKLLNFQHLFETINQTFVNFFLLLFIKLFIRKLKHFLLIHLDYLIQKEVIL
jgi:hypothetical protein